MAIDLLDMLSKDPTLVESIDPADSILQQMKENPRKPTVAETKPDKSVGNSPGYNPEAQPSTYLTPSQTIAAAGHTLLAAIGAMSLNPVLAGKEIYAMQNVDTTPRGKIGQLFDEIFGIAPDQMTIEESLAWDPGMAAGLEAINSEVFGGGMGGDSYVDSGYSFDPGSYDDASWSSSGGADYGGGGDSWDDSGDSGDSSDGGDE